jgi:hypothetical protein
VFQSHQTIAGVPVHDTKWFPWVLEDDIITDPLNLEGESRAYPFDAEQTLAYNNQFVVLAGLPVDIVVQVEVDFNELYGYVFLDLESSPQYGLNVPFVLAALT